MFKQRKISFPRELQDSAAIIEFIDELTSVTPGGFKSLHDDAADSISQLPLLEYFNPMNSNLKKTSSRVTESGKNNYFFTAPPEEYTSSYIV